MEPGLRQLAVQRVSEWVPLPALARPTVLPGAGPGGVTRSQPEMRHVHIAGPRQPVRHRQQGARLRGVDAPLPSAQPECLRHRGDTRGVGEGNAEDHLVGAGLDVTGDQARNLVGLADGEPGDLLG